MKKGRGKIFHKVLINGIPPNGNSFKSSHALALGAENYVTPLKVTSIPNSPHTNCVRLWCIRAHPKAQRQRRRQRFWGLKLTYYRKSMDWRYMLPAWKTFSPGHMWSFSHFQGSIRHKYQGIPYRAKKSTLSKCNEFVIIADSLKLGLIQSTACIFKNLRVTWGWMSLEKRNNKETRV